MNRRFLAFIGPLPGSGPAMNAYLLFPGDPDRPAVFAPSLAEALDELQDIAAHAPILCEPALAAEGAALGLDSAAWHDRARADFLAIALGIDDPEAFSQITDSWLILQFCLAAQAFVGRLATGWPEEWRVLSLHVARRGLPDTGWVTEPVTGLVTKGPGLVLPDAPMALAAPVQVTDVDGLAVMIAPGEAMIQDALARALATPAFVPRPFRLRNAEKLPVTIQDLTVLTAGMSAVAGITHTTAGHGTAKAGQIFAEIRARPA